MNFRHFIMILLLSFNYACNSDQNTNTHNHGPNGHNHDPSRVRVDQTIWTDQSELFVEYPVLVVGKPTRFAAHFTKLKGHKPIESGSVKVILKNKENEQFVLADKPSSIGIFKPTIRPNKPGLYTLIFKVKTPTFKDEIIIHNIQVFNSVVEANNAHSTTNLERGIPFLKEQAWNMDFETEKASKQLINDVVKTSGVWRTSPSNKLQLVATAQGIINFNGITLSDGIKVKKGQVLLTINSKNLTSNNIHVQFLKAKANFKASKQEYTRKKALLEKQIIALSEFEIVEKQYQISKANYETLKSGFSSTDGKQIKAPFDGVINALSINNGDFVQEGEALFTIIKSNSNLLETYINPAYYNALNTVTNIWFQAIPDQWTSLEKTKGEIQSINPSVNSDNPMVTIYVNTEAQVKKPIGSFTNVHIAFGNQSHSVVIPQEALLEDYGQYSIIVQISGERFERRPIVIGRQNGNYVEIISGLKENEVVVTKGAYQVKMASMSGQAPAHGHAH